MSKATKFYLPFFKTGYPNAKLYTYLSGTNTLVSVYKDVGGTLHTNPIIMDNKGDTVIYIDKDLVYRYRLVDQFDNLIYDVSNIKQLNGERGTPGGPRGEKGLDGKRGPQGISGIQGETTTGPQGDKGLDYLNAIEFTQDGVLTIPKGVGEIWVTATGGGGAGASWSPYFYLGDYKSARTPAEYSGSYSTTDGGFGSSENKMSYDFREFFSLIFTPGSGFSGQSVYRKKITLDKTKENKINVYIGAGGITNLLSQAVFNGSILDGGDGQETSVHINDKVALTLKGGVGGKNQFPNTTDNLPAIATEIKYNQGFNSTIIYGKPGGGGETPSMFGRTSQLVWDTQYREKSGSTFVNKNIKLGYTVGVSSSSTLYLAYLKYPMQQLKDLEGEENIFGSIYSVYPNFRNYSQFDRNLDQFKTSERMGSAREGWGAGGASFITYYNLQSDLNNGSIRNTFDGMLTGTGNPSTLIVFDKDLLKETVIKYMQKFKIFSSYDVGVTSVPSKESLNVWNTIDNFEADLKNNTSNLLYSGPGFYKIDPIAKVYPAGNIPSYGSSGVNGFCLIEYGSIKDMSK